MISESEINAVKDFIVTTLNPEQVILFGSYGRGDYNENSDLDLLVVLPDERSFKGSRFKTVNYLYKNSPRTKTGRDFIVYTHDEFEYWKDSHNNIIGHAFREGKKLYEKRT